MTAAPSGLAAGVLAVVTVLLLLPAPRRPPGADVVASRVRPGRLLALGGLGAGVAGWTVLSARRFVLVVLLALVALGVARIVRRRQAARAADRRADQVLAVCEGVASDLAAGQPPLTSLERAAAEWAELAPVAVAARMGADVPAALRVLSARPGARQLRTLAASWHVAHATGSGLAGAIGQAAEAIRTDRRTTRLVAAELAAARATARLLAVLPIGVLALGAGIGGDPVGFLTGTTAGLVCLATGLALSFAGLTWLERIADRVLGR